MSWNGFKIWHEELNHRRGSALLAWRFFVLLVVTGGIAAIYSPVAILTQDRSYDLMTSFDEAIPFLPWTWWIYFPGYLFGLTVAVLTMRDNRILYGSIAAIVMA